MVITELQKNEVKDILRSGNKLDAVKYLKDNFGLSLKQAKILADQIEKSLPPGTISANPTLHTKNGNAVFKLTGGIFSVVGALILSIAGYIFYSDVQFIDKAVRINAKVVSDPHQPLFEYEYNGQLYNYRATSSSSPPSYFIGEESELYINPENPHDALINDFHGRYLVISILGFLGGVFFTIGAGLLYVLNRPV